jgi:hypothetical protein
MITAVHFHDPSTTFRANFVVESFDLGSCNLFLADMIGVGNLLTFHTDGCETCYAGDSTLHQVRISVYQAWLNERRAG